MDNKLQEIFDKYNVTEKNISTGNLKKLKKTISELQKLDKVLLLTCSNRYNWDPNKVDIPKSTILAMVIDEYLNEKSVLIDVPELNIVPCEGNVSRADGNSCGLRKAKLKNDEKNPSGHHRCWASLNNSDDELWKISKELFESDCVMFFSSIRWGQTNMYYQNLIERLNWIENRHTTLKEDNVIKDIESGYICVGQNWNGENVTETQKEVHRYYGFKINDSLYWNWQYTKDSDDETQTSYKKSHDKFLSDMKIDEKSISEKK